MIPKSAQRFSEKIMLKQEPERDDGARKIIRRPGRKLGMTIVQEITFAVLAAVGAVAGSEVIVRLWHVFQILF